MKWSPEKNKLCANTHTKAIESNPTAVYKCNTQENNGRALASIRKFFAQQINKW